jgi:hypothetical protein
MRTTICVSALCLLALALAGCASPPQRGGPYKPSLADKPVGYAEAVLRPGYIEVGYVGSYRISQSEAQYYAMLRAAEVTVQAGKQYFEVFARRTDTGRRVIHVPPVYELRETGFTAADGTPETQLVEVAPGYDKIRFHPVVTLVIHLLDGPSPAGWTAVDVLRRGREKGIVYSPQTEVVLAAKALSPDAATTQPR